MKKKTKLLALVSIATVVSLSAISSITYAALKERQEISENINSKVNSILNSLAASGSNISTLSLTEENNNETYTHSTKTDKTDNSTFYHVDTDNYMIRLEKDTLDTKAIYGKATNYSINTTCTKDTARDVANSLYTSLELPTDYELVYLEQFDDCLWEANYQKSYNGTYNQYESVKMIFSPENSEIAALTVFNDSCDNFSVQTTVSQESAQSIALETNKISSENIENVSLGFARVNNFVDENKSTSDTSGHQVWIVKEKISNNAETTIYVDVNSGEVLGGETTVW